MQIPKPSDADKEYFRSVVPDEPGVEIKAMFGNLGAFVNGNMFMGLFGEAVGVRLDEHDRERLLAQDGAGPFGPVERPMGGYVSLPVAWRTAPAKTRRWIDIAFTQVSLLPPKQKPARKAKAPKS